MTTPRRKTCENALVGASAELPVSELPTLRNVLAKAKLVKERSVAKISRQEVSRLVADEVKEIWSKVNAVLLTKIISDKYLVKKIETQLTVEYEIQNKKGKNLKVRRENFEKKLDKLFNILLCQVRTTPNFYPFTLLLRLIITIPLLVFFRLLRRV